MKFNNLINDMTFIQLNPKQALNKAYLKQKLTRNEIVTFKNQLSVLLGNINNEESEENAKNHVIAFLRDTFYKDKNEVNTKGRIDLVIHLDNSPRSKAGVLIEAKRPVNRSEMITVNNINAKAMHELILYYLQERIDENNIDIKYLVATNIYEWFIFDTSVFDKLFYQSKTLVKDYEDWRDGRKARQDTGLFYSDIAKPFLDNLQEDIEFTYFNLREYSDIISNQITDSDNRLVALYKLLTPEHLLKLSFVNDSNSLDPRFYSELLHIIGLEEVKEGSKKIIRRKREGSRNPASLLENTINTIINEDRLRKVKDISDFGEKTDERLFNIALELCITWINRILFLKLLEAQLLKYHSGDIRFKFLEINKIPDFDELNKLFFQVLAKKIDERSDSVREKYSDVPYLNSSLFELTALEDDAIRINSLDNSAELDIITSTVLKNLNGTRETGRLPALKYLFKFLDAYDFTSEGSDIIQEENKTLINASVLGLIFEKINGYKDGSIFTPGFITMFMSRESLRLAVVQKFKEALSSSPNPFSYEVKGNTPSPFMERGQGVRSDDSIHRERSGVRSESQILPVVQHFLPSSLLENARYLRNHHTNAESYLWELLRNKNLNGLKFRRQHPLKPNIIFDFFCVEARLAVELDGSVHELPDQKEYDTERTKVAEAYGIKVIRFKNDEVFNNIESVINNIFEECNSRIINDEENNDRNSQVDLPDTFDELKSFLLKLFKPIDIKWANSVINTMKICDPAVGSGHFLVSCLNELIAIKSELGILAGDDFMPFHKWTASVENDELILTDREGNIFEYIIHDTTPSLRDTTPYQGGEIKAFIHPEIQKIQKTLFNEKKTIIENCLFGVDINPNSVKICRLRLWIELLKNAYYTEESNFTGLETLPNIDINIKCGNSLISRFAVDADLRKALKSIKWNINDYRILVNEYKETQNKEKKRGIETLIADIKNNFRSEIGKYDPKVLRLDKLTSEYYERFQQARLLDTEMTAKQKEAEKKARQKMEAEITKLSNEIDEIKNNAIYRNAFEWRFEFPEVLDDEGNFLGFDVVIGNPPYMRIQEMEKTQPQQKKYYEKNYQVAKGSFDLAYLFFEIAVNISMQKSNNAFILTHKFLNADGGTAFRDYLIKGKYIDKIAHFGANMIFDSADTYTCITLFSKFPNVGFFVQKFPFKSDFQKLIFDVKRFNFLSYESISKASEYYGNNNWIVFDNEQGFNVFEKIYQQKSSIANKFDRIFQGIATGKDDIYIFEGNDIGSYIEGKFKFDNKVRRIEKNILKSFLKGKDVHRYNPLENGLYILFPYKINNGICKLLKENEIAELYPRAYEWLKETEPIHRKKDNKSTNDNHWYRYARNQGINNVEQPKLSSMEICAIHPNVTLNYENYYHNTKVYSWVKKPTTVEEYKYFLAIANSKLLWWFLMNTGDTLQGDARTFKTNYLNPFPLPENISEEAQQPFVTLVDQILAIKKENPQADTSGLEQEIDTLVYKLYDLTEEEIKIVEGK